MNAPNLERFSPKERLHAASVGEGQAAGSTYSTQGVGLPLPCFASGREIQRARSELVPRKDSTEDSTALTTPPRYFAPSGSSLWVALSVALLMSVLFFKWFYPLSTHPPSFTSPQKSVVVSFLLIIFNYFFFLPRKKPDFDTKKKQQQKPHKNKNKTKQTKKPTHTHKKKTQQTKKLQKLEKKSK